MELDPVAVGLKFGFLAVLYLFLLWVARSALKDLRTGREEAYIGPSADYDDATGYHAAPVAPGSVPKLRVEAGAGLQAGSAYDLSDGALLGRGEQTDIPLEGGFASPPHARPLPPGGGVGVGGVGSPQRTPLYRAAPP